MTMQVTSGVINAVSLVAVVQKATPQMEAIDEVAFAIQGEMLIGNEMVEYLCDPGAALTVISSRLYERINTITKPIPLRPYIGQPLTSCNLKIKILGEVVLDRCTLSLDFSVKNIRMVVMENLTHYECLMGRDMIARIPIFSRPVEELRDSVNRCTENLYSKEKDIISRPDDEVQETEMGIIMFPGLPEHSPVAEYSSSDLTQKLEATTRSEEDCVKALIEKKLEEVAQLRMKLRGIEEVHTTPKPKAEESVALLRTGMVSTQTEEPPQSSADSQVDSNWQAPQAAANRTNLKDLKNPSLQKQIVESSSSD